MEHGKERMEEERKPPFPKGRRMKRNRTLFNPALHLGRTCSQANDTPSLVDGSSYSVNEYFPPPSSSSSHESPCELTEEEHVVVSSLLLLSNYHESPRNVTQINEAPPDQLVESMPKPPSSKFIGPDGNVYYRCNFCGRDFRSFQALGGHRASHKKSRPTQLKNESSSKFSMNEGKIEQSNKTNITEIKEIKEVGEEEKDEEDMLKLSMNSSSSMDIAKARIHQCTTCGSEFTSGQALGGHMRRHRNPAMALDATTSDVVGQDFDIKEEDDILKENRSSPLALDLNLPAPLEEKRETTPEANFKSDGTGAI